MLKYKFTLKKLRIIKPKAINDSSSLIVLALVDYNLPLYTITLCNPALRHLAILYHFKHVLLKLREEHRALKVTIDTCQVDPV